MRVMPTPHVHLVSLQGPALSPRSAALRPGWHLPLTGSPSGEKLSGISSPSARAWGIIDHPLMALGSSSNHPLRSPSALTDGHLGTRRTALPVRMAHQLKATLMRDARHAVYFASSFWG